jgi:PAS domain S-box-containing protein
VEGECQENGQAMEIADKSSLQKQPAEDRQVTAETEFGHRAEQLAALHATLLDITTERDLSTLLRTIVKRATRLLQGTGGGLYLCDPEREEVCCVVSYNTPRDYTGVVLRYGEGAAGTIAATGNPLIIDDYPTWPGRASAFEGEEPFGAVISTPMIWQGRVTGVIHVLHDSETRRFTQVDLELLTLFANQAVIAVENARLYEQTREQIDERKQAEAALKAHARQQTALFKLSAQLAMTLDEADVCEQVVLGLRDTLGYANVGLFLVDEGTGERVLRASQGWPDAPRDWRIPPGQGLSERPLLDGQLHHTSDVTNDPDYLPGLNTGAEVDVPLRIGDQMVGVLVVESKQPHTLGEADFAVLTAAANQASVALHRARQHQSVKAAEASYRGLFDGVPVGLYRTTPAGRFLDVNPALVHMLGYPDRETLMAVNANELYVDDEERARWRTRLEQEGIVRDFEVRFRQSDGTVIWARDTARALRDVDGRVLYFEGSMEDIAERKRAEETLKQRNHELATLFEATTAISSNLSLGTVLQTVAEHMVSALGSTGCALSIWRRERNAVETLAEHNTLKPENNDPPGTNYALSDYPATRQVLETGQPMLIQHDDPTADQAELAWMAQQDVKTVLILPLIAREWVWGILELIDDAEGRQYTAEEISLAESLTAQAALAIENAQLHEAVQQELAERARAEEENHSRSRELALLNRIIAASAAEPEPRTILETACRELAHAFDVPQAMAAQLNDEKTTATVVAEYRTNDRPPALNETFPVEGNPWYQYLFTYKAPLAVDDAFRDPWLSPIPGPTGSAQFNATSLLILPLIIDGDVVGSLSLTATQRRTFSASEISLAWNVADQVAGGLARARLAQTQRRLTAAIEQAAESIVILDTEGTILYVNPAFERITGYSRAEAVGQTLHILNSGKHDAAFFKNLWATVSAGEVWHGRIVNKQKDGTLYTDETTVTPVRNESNTIVNYVEVKRDVTRELELEEQYRQSQKMEAVGQLTAGIAHDFNNLLTAINGFAELMQFELSVDDPLQELVVKILRSGERASDLIRQLLAFSRKQIIDPRVLDLNAVVTDMDRMLQRIIGENIELQTILIRDLWPVKADPSQIEQVIVNLAVNARDAMPGGGKLIIETANVMLDEDYAADHVGAEAGEHVLLAVSDTGVGISEDVRARIFEPFFTTKQAGKGTGLGLATVYGIVKQSGGNIWVYSEEGVGTTFKVYLPRGAESRRTLDHPEIGQEMPLGKETILLVEDEAGVRDLARVVLQRQGYTVLEAADGQQAVQLADGHSGPIHLLLTDVVMPGSNGKTLAQNLIQTHPEMSVLFMSGYTNEAIAHHGVLEPGVAFLQKPFHPMTLARKVRKVLDNPPQSLPTESL